MTKSKKGMLVVVTGLSGSGQDSVMNGLWTHPKIKKYNFNKIITCTDRSPRPGELNGREYHFVNYDKLQEMDSRKQLVEQITTFGSCHKATPRSEIERLTLGENLIWRIDLSRATEVASGNFFKRIFPGDATEFQKHTIVFYVTAPESIINERRKKRDGGKYDPSEYKKRDADVKEYTDVLKKIAIPVSNLDDRLDEAIDFAVNSVVKLYDKIKE